ncbi:hypothetical protein TREMEDRAFT_70378 [Tremella mesenterica DSM 1558]|uniref:uncharacterized protein n=1 Tax=Tremella mesenterica (strain ATCC 24925 / CBS 8224 / DSM 1558 / NBRC 9311 / NRRL Y-6157 / RJB 2259-6 / UBC 559-6) TaxID=578456 RepID=UPI00032D4423|nr:uncharacterized protein TREMEDRAFT_70378 [Tremella mesenterica DSM 1558]EIW65967.1 hypothetical protein TREMEDRAFT_70378 [Tremella mesenterica DSM 1558]
MSLFQRLIRLRRGTPNLTAINYTPEHAALAKTIVRRRKIFRALSSRVSLIRLILATVGVLWILALPYEGLWKRTYVDENALQPGQVNTYWDWGDVHRADIYLGELEKLRDKNASFAQYSEYFMSTLSSSGLHTSSLSTSTYSLLSPPRSSGLETILLSAPLISHLQTPNLRGISILLSLAHFLRGQPQWAFDFLFIFPSGHMEGLEDFMKSYDLLFPGRIWTSLNIDYPGHSFSHLGIFYEGINGRLPNQDLINTVQHIARWTGGVPMRVHDVVDEADGMWERWKIGFKGLWEHGKFTALGRASGAHGVLARHRIDALTLYCPPSSSPHGFHTLGKIIESTLRSLSNLLERPHASYFFYLIPRPSYFIPVGNYLPSIVLLGASLTIGGLSCPRPLEGFLWLIIPHLIGLISWMIELPEFSLIALKSMENMSLLLYGALIPTLGMVNFPQSVLLTLLVYINLVPRGWVRLMLLGFNPAWVRMFLRHGIDLKDEWERYGNITWVGVYMVWIPLWCCSAMLRETPF